MACLSTYASGRMLVHPNMFLRWGRCIIRMGAGAGGGLYNSTCAVKLVQGMCYVDAPTLYIPVWAHELCKGRQ